MGINYRLLALLEAAGDDDENADAPAEEDTDTTQTEETPVEDTAGDESHNDGEENQDDNADEDQDNNDDQSSEDDFSLDDDNGEDNNEDDGPIPDGLTDPDDDGSGDMAEEDEEQNVQTTVLQLSKLDRVLAKKKCFNDFQDFRASITSARTMIDDNEVTVNPEVRERAFRGLDAIMSKCTDYLTYRFSYQSYEEALESYLLFVKELNTIVDDVKTNGLTKV